MPELPDVTAYVEAIGQRVVGHSLIGLRVFSLFLLRSVSPKPEELAGLEVVGVRRLGKRIVLELEGQVFVVIHLMIAGRFRWSDAAKPRESRPLGRILLAEWTFDSGVLSLIETGSKKRAGLWLVRGERELASHDPGGIDPTTCSLAEFRTQLLAENRTLKRALTQPRRFSGIGNAYSDEILHAAGLSPLRLTLQLKPDEVDRLHAASRETLLRWTTRLREEFGGRFPRPEEITAFRPDFAAHGKAGKPCPVCGKPIQRIVYAENETNYCAQCQNEGRLLADRALSRLLKSDWPRTLEELEAG